MDQQTFLTAISVLAQEIDMLKYQKEQLANENEALRNQVNDLYIRINIKKED